LSLVEWFVALSKDIQQERLLMQQGSVNTKAIFRIRNTKYKTGTNVAYHEINL